MTTQNMLPKIIYVIKRFKFEELETSVMPLFPEVSWANIRSELVKSHKPFTSANAAQFIKKSLLNVQLREKTLDDRFLALELIDVSRHSTRKIWYGHSLVGKGKAVAHRSDREIKTNINNYCQSINLKIDAKFAMHNGITYISITKQRRKGEFIQVITHSMGYDKSKPLNLLGKDLTSLNSLCWKKKQGAQNAASIEKAPVYRDGAPDIKSTGIDYTQNKQRKMYAEKCFGEDAPTLELLAVNGPRQPWMHKDISAKLPNETVQIGWEFHSHDIATCLTNLIERRILVTPVPDYISNFMTLGKNNIQLKNV